MPQLPTIWKHAKDFVTFIFWISSNLAKYAYEPLPLEQHHKIEKQNSNSAPKPKSESASYWLVKFCQKEKLKIKISSKSNFGGFSRQKWGKEKKKEKSPDSYI